MSEQDNIDHGKNIAQMLGRQTEQISQLTDNYRQAIGDKTDAEQELMSVSRDNINLRLKLRKQAREHTAEIELRDERIREVTGFCNEQTAEVRSLKADLDKARTQPTTDATDMVLHLLLVESVNYFHRVVGNLAHAFVNKRTNKASRDLVALASDAPPYRTPSFSRIVSRMCNNSGIALSNIDLSRETVWSFIQRNTDLFCKDEAYQMSRGILCSLCEATPSGDSAAFGVRALRNVYRDLHLISCDKADKLNDDTKYQEMFVSTIDEIFVQFIKENNLK